MFLALLSNLIRFCNTPSQWIIIFSHDRSSSFFTVNRQGWFFTKFLVKSPVDVSNVLSRFREHSNNKRESFIIYCEKHVFVVSNYLLKQGMTFQEKFYKLGQFEKFLASSTFSEPSNFTKLCEAGRFEMFCEFGWPGKCQ